MLFPFSTGHRLTAEQLEGLKAEPIPLAPPSPEGWQDKPIKASNEPLVPLGPDSPYPLFTSSIYFGEHTCSPYAGGLQGSLATIFVRQSVAESLVKVEKILPEGLHIVVFDGYRPTRVQETLFNAYLQALRARRPGLDEAVLLKETQKYVAKPSNDLKSPAPHSTGGAVDLAIVRVPRGIETAMQKLRAQTHRNAGMERLQLFIRHARMLNFGTPFDYGGYEAAVHHFEKEAQHRKLSANECEAQANRRLLYHLVLGVAGLQSRVDEWWHFNSPKSQMGAQSLKLAVAQYGCARLSEANRRFERTRQNMLKHLDNRTALQPAAIILPTE
jgi:zinc D-Ala-D-Ala dipeptidase